MVEAVQIEANLVMEENLQPEMAKEAMRGVDDDVVYGEVEVDGGEEEEISQEESVEAIGGDDALQGENTSVVVNAIDAQADLSPAAPEEAEAVEPTEAAEPAPAPAEADAAQADTNEAETPEQAAKRKKQAKNKAKRERQKAKAKAALQQVRAAEAAGVSVGQDSSAVSQAQMQAEMQAQMQAQMQQQMAQMQAQLQAQMDARMQAQALPQNAAVTRPSGDAAAPVGDLSGATGVNRMIEQTASTSSRTEELLRRVEMLAERQAANRNDLAAKHQLGDRPQQPKQEPKPVQKRLEDMKGEELAQELHKRAAIYATNDKWEDASTTWGQATEVTPDSAEMWYYRGIASQKLERTLDAEKYWKRATKLGHKQSAGLLAGVRSKRAQEARIKADALLQQDKFEKAIGMYTAAINICPDNPDHCAQCHNGCATALGLTAKWEDAKAAWAKASELVPTNPAFLHYQGLASLKLEEFDEAEDLLAKSLDMGHERSREQLETCQRMKRERFAVIVYQRAMKLWEDVDKHNAAESNSGRSSARNSKAQKSRMTKSCKAALAEFREAAKAGYHNKAGIHIMSALCLTKLQRWGEAVREIKDALAIIPAKVASGDNDDGGGSEEWSFQGLDRARLVGMAVNLEKMHQAQEKSEVHTMMQAARKS